jgi:hypothetical protein
MARFLSLLDSRVCPDLDDMFHDTGTICLCISPDLDGYQGTKK